MHTCLSKEHKWISKYSNCRSDRSNPRYQAVHERCCWWCSRSQLLTSKGVHDWAHDKGQNARRPPSPGPNAGCAHFHVRGGVLKVVLISSLGTGKAWPFDHWNRDMARCPEANRWRGISAPSHLAKDGRVLWKGSTVVSKKSRNPTLRRGGKPASSTVNRKNPQVSTGAG